MASDPNILKTAAFIIIAPFTGLILAFLISLWFIHSFKKGTGPRLVSLGVLVLVAYLVYAGLVWDPSKLKSHYTSYAARVIFDTKNFKWILLAFILSVMAITTLYLSSLNAHKANRWFRRLQLVSSAAFSIGHGGNDAQKVMGIIMASLIAFDPKHYSLADMAWNGKAWWVPLGCYTAIAVGTMSGGWKIIKTMGTRITKVTPFEGVAAETAGAVTLFVTEGLKIPVSTTHTITGAIVGVGATKRLSAVRWGITVNLLWAWILTIPVSGILAAIVYSIVRIFL
jgi:PiT family inorganic phosphate transporter